MKVSGSGTGSNGFGTAEQRRVDAVEIKSSVFQLCYHPHSMESATKIMISYAQWGEDVVLNRLFHEQSKGFYVDVGANDPIADSVTQHFYLKGWNGINIEPGLAPFQRFVQERTRDINLNVAVSDREGTLLFHELPSKDGLSTFNSELAAYYRSQGDLVVERNIPITTLRAILEAHGKDTIDFMKIDVEGHEQEVLTGMDWHRWRPRVLVIEAGWYPECWEPILLAQNYIRALADNLNMYFVPEEDGQWLSLLRLPANVSDQYVPYQLLQAAEMQWRASEKQPDWESVGPVITNIAMHLNRFKQSHPLLLSVAKKAMHWVGLKPEVALRHRTGGRR